MQYDKIAVEDHSYTATKEERCRNENAWKLSSNAEGVQGPLNQRNDFKDAKQTCKRLYHEKTTITGSGNKPIHPEQQVRQKHDQQFESHETHVHLSSSSSSRWQPSSDLWSMWNWDSWKSSPWSEQCFFFFFQQSFQMSNFFACRKFNLLAINGWREGEG